MGTVTLDDGRSFKVDDSFGKLPLDQQQKIIGALKDQVSSGVASDIQKGQTVTGTAPVKEGGLSKKLDQAIRSIAEGVTLGYADRIAARLESITGIGGKSGAYQENLKKEQAKTAEVPSEIAIPGQIAGAVAGTVAGAPIVRGAAAIGGAALPSVANAASKIPGVIKTALGAAGVGAVAGSSQGDTPEQRTQNAATGAAAGAATGGTLAVGGKLFGAIGDKIMTSVIRPTARDIADGFSLDTIKKFDLGGSLNTTYTKTQAALGALSGQLREKLGKSTATIDLSKIVDQTEKELSTAAGKLKGFGANQKITSAIESLKKEAETVGNDLSIPDAQIVKQAAGSFGAWQYGRPDPESKASEVVFNAFYNKLKTAIENASPEGVKEINQQLSKLIPVNNALIRRMPVADRNYALSLGDLVTLAASVSHPSGLALTGLNLAQKSGAVGNALSKFGPRVTRTAVPAGALSGLGAPSALQ